MCLILESCDAYFSEKGHKGFLYPQKEKKVILPKGTHVKKMPWVSVSNLVPIKVDKRSIFELLQTGAAGQFVILWVEKSIIKRVSNAPRLSRTYSK